MRTRTGLVAPLTGMLLALSLSACADADEEKAAVEPAPSSPTASASEPEPSDSVAEPGDGATEPAEQGDRAVSAAFLQRLKDGMGEEGSVHVEMKMTGPVGATAEGDTRYGPDGSEMKLTMEMSNVPGGAMQMVAVDGAAYMSMPGVTEPGKFFEIDLSNPMFSGLDQGMSPADSFKAFEAGLETVKKVRAGEVGGEPTTRYRLEVDTEKALEASGQPTVPGLPETLSYDVWLDSQDRMRRLVYALAGTKVTMDMTDWGKEVTIVAPDKADIVKAPPMMSPSGQG